MTTALNVDDVPEYEPDPNECPNCGAPTGGGPCGNANQSGLSCRDLVELDAAAAAHDWDRYGQLAAAIIANYPQAAVTLAADLKEAKERADAR